MKITLRGLLIWLSLFLALTACQEEDILDVNITETTETDLDLSTRKISQREYSQNMLLLDDVSRIIKDKNANKSSNDNSITLFEEQALYIEAGD